MVHFQHLDVEIFRSERLGRLLDEHREQIDAEAHIAGFDDRRVAGGCGDLCIVLGGAAGGADDMHDPRLRGIAGKLDACGGNAEIEHAIGLCEGRQGIVGDGDAQRSDAGEFAGILAEIWGAWPFDRRRDARPGNRVDGANQRLAHAAGGSYDDEAHIAHALLP